jgi:glutamate dehydrogenase (NAD(P)+)
VAEAPGTEAISNRDLLELDVDVLIPAALDRVITDANVEGLRARVVVEAANNPVTPSADDALLESGVTVIPDILVNAGGVTVSYLEWVQNIQQFRWDEDEVNAELKKKMALAWKNVHSRATVDGIPLRLAAFAIAVERVARAATLRGYV